MSQRRIRLAAAAALAATLTLAAPAKAVGWHTWTLEPGWIGKALQWIAQVWTQEATVAGGEGTLSKSDQGIGIDPDGSTATSETTGTDSEAGHGIDPNGG